MKKVCTLCGCQSYEAFAFKSGHGCRPRPSSLRPAEPAASRHSAASERNGIPVPDLEQQPLLSLQIGDAVLHQPCHFQ